MFVGESGNIYIETQHPAYPHVIDFLISCCEPVSRTQCMEQYRLDSGTLSAASAEGTYSCDMIRTILTCFRLDAQQHMALNLAKLAALEKWAVSLDADKDPESYRRAVPFLVDMDAQEMSSDAAGTAPASAAATGGGDGGSGAPARKWLKLEVKREEDEDADAARIATAPIVPTMRPAVTPPPPRRVLSLAPPSTSSNPPTPAAQPVGAAVPQKAVLSPGCARQTLVALAADRRELLDRPLPEAITQMLSEEEASSRLRLVLQPRLRRFSHTQHTTRRHLSPATHVPQSCPTAGAGHLATNGKDGSGGDNNTDAIEDDERLHYFLVSHDRAQLETVLEGIQEFLVPARLHGVPRWIVSDVDRGIEASQKVKENSAVSMLRRLYAPRPQRYPSTSATTGRPHGHRVGAAHAAAADPWSSRIVYKSQIQQGKLLAVKLCLFRRYGIRADCDYDYLQDHSLHVEGLSLARHVRLRPHQVASLDRFARGSKAHQGIVVLPCGAGKTLTGIGAATIVKKKTIVMCVNNMSVYQWQREFLRWTNLTPSEVTVCTRNEKPETAGAVFITTYSMLIKERLSDAVGETALRSKKLLESVLSETWGLLLLDEVHTAVASHFQTVLDKIRYKCALGLSATLLREDGRIGDLRHMIGPKLYEANWLELTRAGFLAQVECAEVQCPMPIAYYNAYVNAATAPLGFAASTKRLRRRGGLTPAIERLATCNPNKLWCTQALLEFHRNRSPPDKVIIFCQFVEDARFYAQHLHLPYMTKDTSEDERTHLLQYFQLSSAVNAIILTPVGDVALDLPCASVVIQISGLGASRRQEAQRLGRILRPKPPSLDNTCSYFYTMASQDTTEIKTSYGRQSWLRDQGFAYRVLHCDAVLSELRRVGRTPVCIGAPQWWYQYGTVTAADRETAPPVASLVRYEEAWWAPFSTTASELIQKAFVRGKDGCELSAKLHLGPDTPVPPADARGGASPRLTEKWHVRFSSVDAPNTFGTVKMGDGEDEGRHVRRIRFGQLDPSHDCLKADGPCVPYALTRITHAHHAAADSAE